MTKRPHANLDLIKRVLGSEFLEVNLKKLTLEEHFDEEASKVTLEMSDTSGNALVVEGQGVGLLDALFHGLLARFAVEYHSLESIELASFVVQARIDTKKEHAGADAVGEVVLDVRNSEGKIFQFSDASRSIARSTARAVVAAVEYFVNAERAYITLYKSREDAKARHRDDLVTRYTREMAEVVKSTSYTEVIENIEKQL